jgi:hypothetical protein
MTTVQIEASSDVSRSWNRIAGVAGIAFAVLFVGLGFGIAADAPVFTDGADELRTWFGDNQGPIAFFTWIGPLTFGVLRLVFAAGLLRRLETADTSGGILSRLSFGGALATFAAGVVGLALWGVMTLDPVLEGASDGLLVTLSALDSVVFFVLMPWASAVFIIAASVMMLQTRAMPAWLGGLGCLSGVVSIVGGAWLFDGDPNSAIANVGFLGEVAGLIWIVAASVLLLRSTAD